MPSAAHSRFSSSSVGSRILKEFYGTPSPASTDQDRVDQECLKAAIAHIVGSWEGYFEEVLQEFVAKTRVHAHSRAWPLIVQFEVMVRETMDNLNTPNWDKTRNLLIQITGVDPYSSWIWAPTFTNQQDTKAFFDGVMDVRHAFAHGFNIPSTVKGLSIPGKLDLSYVQSAFDCINFFVNTTDALLEHELKHRHNCKTGWY